MNVGRITGDVLLLLALLVAAMVLAVFLAAAEASFLRVSEHRVRSLGGGGDPKAARVGRLLERLPQVLNLILLLALLAQIGSATITGVLAQRWLGNVGVTIASVLLTIVLYVYGEAIPKTCAVRHVERTATFVAPFIAVMELLFRHPASRERDHHEPDRDQGGAQAPGGLCRTRGRDHPA
ncbi:MAG TPA: DUF21 domain-containing protein [Acidimicrobiia bacterium]